MATSVDLIIEPRARDLGDFTVRRVLPYAKRREVGPFVFFDHMGPVVFPAGKGINVRPHPHIGLATVTYLFEGAILHRDSLGTELSIEPGAVNWMVAGRGIVHSERTSNEDLARDVPMEGIQAWIGLPVADEETDPSFAHHTADDLPMFTRNGVKYRLIAGNAFDRETPVRVFSPMFYLHGEAPAGASIDLPGDHAERAIYVVSGALVVDGETIGGGKMVVFNTGAAPDIAATSDTRFMQLGGAPLEGKRTIWWNFVSSDTDRMKSAKTRWKSGGFETVPGDAEEFIPLPED
ncbi:MAG: redox-sensitive bicupin YhaK (pirin superfamily) [Paracoccaceae bacterium]|jgi:redox-sensitive bicupin YhaK (pirin superfamily)